MKFFFKDFFSKCDQIRWKLRLCSYLLNKYLIETSFSGVVGTAFSKSLDLFSW